MLRVSATSVWHHFSIYRGYTIPSLYILVKNYNLRGKIQLFYSFSISISFIITLSMVLSISKVTNYCSITSMTVHSGTKRKKKRLVLFSWFVMSCGKNHCGVSPQFQKSPSLQEPKWNLPTSLLPVWKALVLSWQKPSRWAAGGIELRDILFPLRHLSLARATRQGWSAQVPAEKSFWFCL